MMIIFASNLHLFMRRPAKQASAEKENFQSHGNSSMIEMFEQRFHPFSGWFFFTKLLTKKCKECLPVWSLASEDLDVDICTKSARAMSQNKTETCRDLCGLFTIEL